jgi:hypothetical protein
VCACGGRLEAPNPPRTPPREQTARTTDYARSGYVQAGSACARRAKKQMRAAEADADAEAKRARAQTDKTLTVTGWEEPGKKCANLGSGGPTTASTAGNSQGPRLELRCCFEITRRRWVGG